MQKEKQKAVEIGDRFIYNNLIVMHVLSLRGTNVILSRGRIRQEVPKLHLLSCTLYQKENIGV